MAIDRAQLKLLRSLCRCKKATSRRARIERGGPALQKSLREVAHNVLKGNVRLSKGQLSKLRKHKAGVRALASKSTSLNRRKAIQQRGGFLSSLLLPVLGSLASGILGGVLRR